MKKIVLLFFVSSFLASVYSQTGLTPTQLKEYNNQKLSLESKTIGMGSYGNHSISYSSWNKWDAFQGFNPIKESELYRIAGYEDLANQAKKREKRGKAFIWTGLGMSFGGLLLMLAAPDSEGAMITGGITSLVGLTIGYIGIDIKDHNLKPYDVASGIADEYNLQLSITIKKNF